MRILVRVYMVVSMYVGLCLCTAACLFAQEKERVLYLIGSSPTEQKLIDKYDIADKYSHTDSLYVSLYRMLSDFQRKSFWEASLSEVKDSSQHIKAYIKLGKPYTWHRFGKGNLATSLVQQVNFKEKNYLYRPIYQSEIEDLKEKILLYSENHGYPFATFRLDSISIDSLKRVSAVIDYAAGPEILFDTLYIQGDVLIKNRFLAKYLHIEPEEIFDQNKVNRITGLLKNLPYLRLGQAPSVSFRFDRAYTSLLLKKRRANEINGLLGFLPNENPQNRRSLLLTGALNISLHNLFNTGKYLGFQWERLQISTQRLSIRYEHPILLGSDIDLALNFNLLNQDSSFVNRTLGLDFYYRLGGGGRIKLKLEDRKSTLGEANLFRDLSFLPEVSEVNYLSYGLGYDWNNLDDINFPHRGSAVGFMLKTGTKKVQQNPFVPDSLYRGLRLRSTQVVLEADFARFFSISKRSVLKVAIQSGYIANETLFTNELFRLGGLNSLRGHNENVFFASAFGIGSLEYQWYFEPESYFLLFYDQGFLQERTSVSSRFDNPSGVGLGLNFAVSSGSFRLVYALGQSRTEIFSFNRAKIHFGLLSRF